MNQLIPLLIAAASAFDPLDQTPVPTSSSGSGLSTSLRDILIVVGAALLMALILFLYFFLTRKDRQRNAGSARGTRLVYRTEKELSSGSGRHKQRRKRRRAHSDNLPRNPTLAEAGGLPPLRPAEPEPEPEPGPAAESPSESPQFPPQAQAQ